MIVLELAVPNRIFGPELVEVPQYPLNVLVPAHPGISATGIHTVVNTFVAAGCPLVDMLVHAHGKKTL